MASSVKKLEPFEEIICNRIYDSYDPRLWLSIVSDAQNALLSPSGYQLELFVNLKSSLMGITLEKLSHFLDIVQRVASNYFTIGKAILDDTHSHVICIITP